MNTYFFTGFPGFIATRLIQQIAQEQEQPRFELLVHPSQLEKAYREVERLVLAGAGREEQFSVLAGDITRDGLALDVDVLSELQERVTHVFHLAAIYDLAVPFDLAYQVNVIGTGQVNRFVLGLRNLQRYVYFSTAYVSGDRTGRILETELASGQQFKNHYESTKYEAERLVQEIRGQVPVTIIRPGIVMGDSRTGETVKFDGPYFVMRFLDKFQRLPIPFIGRGEALINLVPVDYILAATLYLAHAPVGANNVYHLTDPRPYRSREAYEKICEALIDKRPTWTLPSSMVLAALEIGSFRRWVKVEKETIAYFSCLAEYDCTEAQRDLAGSGVQCPDFADYITQAAAFYKEHRHDADKLILVK